MSTCTSSEERISYTPGPWLAVDKAFGIVIAGSDASITNVPLSLANERIGEFDPHAFNACQRANARLIAAAPDLLEALEKIRDYDPCGGDEWLTAVELLQRWAVAAIAKAEGRS